MHELYVHLLAAVPNSSCLEVHGFGLHPYVREPLVIADGCAVPPHRPSHGVAFKSDAPEKHRAVE